ncbi:hypothetical protein CCM_09212 [Cordyceps militaris CM01]|uniref:Uncharacterized protein n=1 Tax=Cordyceps militaris (strain CM01) TaxID=983644 RepID=G3JTS2_CORMM|nr:uncharacterized protein CCM_09212 [Cordyceps militaris CM01]EGX88076.1 hypothetical protein CCM_09212 [Cordyceps militaris CM01]
MVSGQTLQWFGLFLGLLLLPALIFPSSGDPMQRPDRKHWAGVGATRGDDQDWVFRGSGVGELCSSIHVCRVMWVQHAGGW